MLGHLRVSLKERIEHARLRVELRELLIQKVPVVDAEAVVDLVEALARKALGAR